MRIVVAVSATLALASLVGAVTAAAARSLGPSATLDGLIQLAPASCPNGKPQGSYLVVTSGSKVVINRASSCAGGAVTLLQPGTFGLPVGTTFTPDPTPAFAHDGGATASLIAVPTPFGGRTLGLATSANDTQDAPTGAAIYEPPALVVRDGAITGDLRSWYVTYAGLPDSTCASASGRGCWQEGSKQVTGTFEATSGTVTLDWSAGQSFTGDSARVAFHLVGHYTPSPNTDHRGVGVVGGAAAVPAPETGPAGATAGTAPANGAAVGTVDPSRPTARDGSSSADVGVSRTGASPRRPWRLLATALVALDVAVLALVARRRRSVTWPT